MEFAMFEFEPVGTLLSSSVVESLERRTIADVSIEEAAREVFDKRHNDVAELSNLNGFYRDATCVNGDAQTIHLVGLKIKEHTDPNSFSRLMARINPFEDIQKEKALTAIPVHIYLLLKESCCAVSNVKGYLGREHAVDWIQQSITASGIRLASYEWNHMLKSFNSKRVDQFAEALRRNELGVTYMVTCRTEEGNLAFRAQITRGDGTTEWIDIENTDIGKKLKAEMKNPDNRSLLAMHCKPPENEEGFLISFRNLHQSSLDWRFTVLPDNDEDSVVEYLNLTARYMKMFRLSPFEYRTFSLDKFVEETG